MSVWRKHDWMHSRPGQLASSHSSFEQPSSEHRHPIPSSTRSFADDIQADSSHVQMMGHYQQIILQAFREVEDLPTSLRVRTEQFDGQMWSSLQSAWRRLDAAACESRPFMNDLWDGNPA